MDLKLPGVATALFAVIATPATAQEAFNCNTRDAMEAGVKSYGEVELVEVIDPVNQNIYQIFAQNVGNELGAESWSLLVTDPRQPIETQTCLVAAGEEFELNFPKGGNNPFPDNILRDLHTGFVLNNNCISEQGFLALSQSTFWREQIIFKGSTGNALNPTLTDHFYVTIQENNAFLGLTAYMPDESSLHPMSVQDTPTYCVAVSGLLQENNTAMAGKIGLPDALEH